MKTYVIRRENALQSCEELEAPPGARSRSPRATSRRHRCIRSYVIAEPGGTLGTVCIYQASGPEALREHAGRVDMPADEILEVADTVVIRPDPEPEAAVGLTHGASPARMAAWQPSSDPRPRRRPTRSSTRPRRSTDYNIFEADRAAGRGAAARGRRVGRERAIASVGAVCRRRAGAAAGAAGQREPAEAAHPRPLRPPHRRGRVPPRLARAAAASAVAARAALAPLAATRGPGAHVARGAAFMCMSQAEAGVGCPISMTYSVIPALRTQPELAAEWEPRLLSARVRPAQRAGAGQARRPLRAWAMTEKQGGSDVRANTTVARAGQRRRPRRRVRARPGTSGSCSAPMCDAFLVLAQADGGLSCFLLPRWTPDGERNRFHIQRLKDKLGNRSNASSEVEFDGAWARLVGEEGARGADDHRDGQPHPPRLRDRRRRRHARRRRPGDPPRLPPHRLRQAS